MGVLGVVLRTVILWVVSLVAAVAVMEGAHRIEVARDQGRAAALEAQAEASASSVPHRISTLPAGTAPRAH